MIHLLIPTFVLLLFLGCGNGTTTNTTNPPNSAQQTQDEIHANLQDTNTTPFQSHALSLQGCIDAQLQHSKKSAPTLETLSCSALSDRDFALLSSLPSLTSLTLTDTALTATDVENIANHINQSQLRTLILENDSLTKTSVDKIDPQFTYSNKHYTNVKKLSFKNNQIEGLLVVDYFPNLESLDLSGNHYDSDRLHHIGFIEALKTLSIGSNPNITNLNNLHDGPKAEASVESIDITNMPNLNDISELQVFQKLKNLSIDTSQASRFRTVLEALKAKGVVVTVH